MTSSWWVLDRVLLDRVFQRAANYLHEQTGYTPREVAQFFGIGAVLGIGLREYLLVGHLNPTMHLLNNLLFPLVFLLVPFMPERLGDSGRNIKRWSLFPARGFTLFLTLFLFGTAATNPTTFHNGVTDLLIQYRILPEPSPVWPMIVYAISTGMMWAEVCFCSVDRPPPRKFRSAKTWGMAS